MRTLANLLLRWLGRYRQSAEEKRLLSQVHHLRLKIADLQGELDEERLARIKADNKVAALEDENRFLTAVAERQRLQVEAEQAITARQVVTGQIATGQAKQHQPK